MSDRLSSGGGEHHSAGLGVHGHSEPRVRRHRGQVRLDKQTEPILPRLHCARFTLQLMAAASKFGLGALVDKCEQALVSSVSVSNCIR